MHRLALAFASVSLFALVGCGNAAPTVSAFTLAVGAKDAAGNTSLDGKVTATDPDDGDRITRFQISATGPVPIQAQPLAVPSGITATDLPIKLVLPAAAPKGEYTFSIVAYDEAEEPSAPLTAKVTLP